MEHTDNKIKRCSICKAEKQFSSFRKDNRTKSGLCSQCRDCEKIYYVSYRDENREKVRTRNREYASTEKGKKGKRKSLLKRKYKITEEEIDSLVEKQKGLCAICDNILIKAPLTKKGSLFSNKMCIDHNHKTNKVRGILCGLCNIGLGYFKDDIIKLEKAAAYLRRAE